MNKLNKSIAAVALTAAFAAPAMAANIPLFPGVTNQLSDNNAEYLINAPGSTDTTLDVGDRLHGIFTIETVENLTAGGTNNLGVNSHELTGIFDVIVVAKVGGPGAWSWSFAPTTAVLGNAAAGLGALTGSLAGTAVAMYEDPAKNFTRIGCATTAICEATATDGALWATFGFGASSFWTASALTDDISIIGAVPPPTPGGSFNLGVDFYINNTGYTPLAQSCLDFTPPAGFKANDVCGSGSLLGKGGANSPFDSFSNVDFTVKLLPEPGSLALMGLALAGLGGMSRRRKA